MTVSDVVNRCKLRDITHPASCPGLNAPNPFNKRMIMARRSFVFLKMYEFLILEDFECSVLD